MPVIYQSGGSGSGATIPELATDPVSPVPESAWVLRTTISSPGTPIGLLLALTQSIAVYTYQFSYRTLEGTTIRTVLS